MNNNKRKNRASLGAQARQLGSLGQEARSLLQRAGVSFLPGLTTDQGLLFPPLLGTVCLSQEPIDWECGKAWELAAQSSAALVWSQGVAPSCWWGWEFHPQGAKEEWGGGLGKTLLQLSCRR